MKKRNLVHAGVLCLASASPIVAHNKLRTKRQQQPAKPSAKKGGLDKEIVIPGAVGVVGLTLGIVALVTRQDAPFVTPLADEVTKVVKELETLQKKQREGSEVDKEVGNNLLDRHAVLEEMVLIQVRCNYVLDDALVIPEDKKTPLNKDFGSTYASVKSMREEFDKISETVRNVEQAITQEQQAAMSGGSGSTLEHVDSESDIAVIEEKPPYNVHGSHHSTSGGAHHSSQLEAIPMGGGGSPGMNGVNESDHSSAIPRRRSYKIMPMLELAQAYTKLEETLAQLKKKPAAPGKMVDDTHDENGHGHGHPELGDGDLFTYDDF